MRGFFPTVRRAKVFVAAAILSVAATACEAPKIEKGTVVALIDSPIRTLDPDQASDAMSQRVANVVHGALLTVDQNMKLAPELAESWTIKGYKTFRFKLREGLRFHDGSPLTAEDAASSIKRYLASGAPGVVAFAKVQSVKAEGAREVVVETSIPQPFLLSDFSVIKIFKKEGGKFIGAGRFVPVEERESSVVARRFDGYFEKPAPDAVSKVVFRYVADDTTRFQLILRGDVNAVFSALSYTKTDYLRAHFADKVQILDSPGIGYGYLCFNFADPRLAKLEVRQAIAHALNIPAILKYRMANYALPATGILAPIHADYYEPEVRRYLYDPAEAERLLDRAGYPRPAPGGMRFSLVFKTTLDKTRSDMARIFANDMRAVGIDVRVQFVEGGTFFADLKARNFQVFESRWVGVTNPSIYFRVFHSSQIKSGSNRGGYSNQRVDELVDKGIVEPDDRKRRAYFSEVQKIVAEELPYLNLWHFTNTFIGGRDLQNVIMYPNGNFVTVGYLRQQ